MLEYDSDHLAAASQATRLAPARAEHRQAAGAAQIAADHENLRRSWSVGKAGSP